MFSDKYFGKAYFSNKYWGPIGLVVTGYREIIKFTMYIAKKVGITIER